MIRRGAIAMGLSLGAGLVVAAAPLAAWAAPVKLAATLGGASETQPGDPDGSGGFVATVDAETNDFCYSLWGVKIGKPTMAHVHSGAAGASGPPVITIDMTGKDSDACIAIDMVKLEPIVKNPADYYINIHTADFPAGAVRGQLVKQ